ncbi:hypothetical protein [Azospirillum sp.]|uniref:hypothetical protein n=1 Tax=Azospirillum sp. TaxID=34012 RepID=UPI003D7486EF
MTDRADLAFVIRWAAAGLVVSVAATALVLIPQALRSEPVIVERALHNMDGRTCERVLQAISDQPRAGERILWLWAEESTPGLYATASRVGPAGEAPALPRPYAFQPPAQAAPPQACSYPNNSLHVLAVEGR